MSTSIAVRNYRTYIIYLETEDKDYKRVHRIQVPIIGFDKEKFRESVNEALRKIVDAHSL